MSLNRRRFLSATAAALAAPAIARAAPEPFVLEERFRPTLVQVRPEFDAGTILVVPQQHYLYWVGERRRAIRYGVGVGKAGLEFKGVATIDHKAEWPSWRPTDEMIERDPASYARYADGVPGGPTNPLGARALYLYQNGVDTYFRIHGTTAPESIGRSVSNGCIRMLNAHVIDLYERVPLGTKVYVY
jgi:lipoprotein-anchoring transpeptidase ErfK/SrfK